MQARERYYETTIVLDSFLKEDDTKSFITKIETFIKNNGGRIDTIEEWGKKRLAYEINRKQYGNYIYFLFESPSSLPELLEREFRLEESILRYLTVLADPQLLAERKESTEPQPAAKSVEETPSTGSDSGDAIKEVKGESEEAEDSEDVEDEAEEKTEEVSA